MSSTRSFSHPSNRAFSPTCSVHSSGLLVRSAMRASVCQCNRFWFPPTLARTLHRAKRNISPCVPLGVPRIAHWLPLRSVMRPHPPCFALIQGSHSLKSPWILVGFLEKSLNCIFYWKVLGFLCKSLNFLRLWISVVGSKASYFA